MRTLRRLLPFGFFAALAALLAALALSAGAAGAAETVTGPGCVVERAGGIATIHYQAGLGDSINLRDDAGWVATLDVNGSEFADDESSTGYTIIRRDNAGRTDFVCSEAAAGGPAGPVVVTDSGCVVERVGGIATIHYQAGLGESINLRSDAGWIATLDVDGSQFMHQPSAATYTIIRRDNAGRNDFVCTEAVAGGPTEPGNPPAAPTEIPAGVVGNVSLFDDPAGCWAVEFEASRGEGPITEVWLTGDVGTSQNLRGGGRWLTTVPQIESLQNNPRSFAVDPSVDTAILRTEGVAGSRSIPCETGWTGDIEFFEPGDPDLFASVTVRARAALEFNGDRFLYWSQSVGCGGQCGFHRDYVTNLSTGEITEISDQLTSRSSHYPNLRSCDGRFINLISETDDQNGPQSAIVDLQTMQVVVSLDVNVDAARGFDCDGNFWYRTDRAAMPVAVFALPR